MTVAISLVNIGSDPGNLGDGDNIRAAFTKYNNSVGNIALAVGSLQATAPNVTYGVFANVSVTNRIVGSLNFYGADTIYINGSPVATSAASFTGGNVANQANFVAGTSTTSSTSGAIVITGTGGIGVGGSIYTGNLGVFGGNVVVASTQDASSTVVAALTSLGGLGVVKNAYLGSQLVVGGATSIGGALTVTGATTINSTTASGSYNSGALVVAGGVGVGGTLTVNGNINLNNNMTIAGNLSVTGAITTGSSLLTTSGPVLYLQTFSNAAPLTYDNLADVGLIMQTYKAGVGASNAFLGWENSTGNLKYFSTGVSTAGNTYSGTAGSAVFANMYATATTISNSTASGALQVRGGAGIAGNLYVGGNVTAPVFNGNTVGNLTGNLTGNISGNTTVSGNITAGVFIGNLYNSTGNITLLSNLTNVSIQGLTTHYGNIVPSANLSYNLGSTTAWWNTVYGVSIQAKYADLAENYQADGDYVPATVVIFGGTAEITVTSQLGDERVAGVVSTNPAYLMNSDRVGAAVALRGRVPCQVVGKVNKGDSLVTAPEFGYAVSVGRDRSYGQAVFAKSLEDKYTEEAGIIEVVIL